jgi:hypothetical protein
MLVEFENQIDFRATPPNNATESLQLELLRFSKKDMCT